MHRITTIATHRLSRATLMGVCVAVALGLTSVGATAKAAESRSGARAADSHRMSFAGTTFASESNENVDIAGTIHIVTRLRGSEEAGWTLDWQTNLDNTSGTGQTSRERYRANGTDRGTVLLPPGPPVREAFFEPSFALQSRVHPPGPIRLTINLVLDADGQVTSIEVEVDDGSFGGPVD